MPIDHQLHLSPTHKPSPATLRVAGLGIEREGEVEMKMEVEMN